MVPEDRAKSLDAVEKERRWQGMAEDRTLASSATEVTKLIEFMDAS
jgi:hypothetical protein